MPSSAQASNGALWAAVTTLAVVMAVLFIIHEHKISATKGSKVRSLQTGFVLSSGGVQSATSGSSLSTLSSITLDATYLNYTTLLPYFSPEVLDNVVSVSNPLVINFMPLEDPSWDNFAMSDSSVVEGLYFELRNPVLQDIPITMQIPVSGNATVDYDLQPGDTVFCTPFTMENPNDFTLLTNSTNSGWDCSVNHSVLQYSASS